MFFLAIIEFWGNVWQPWYSFVIYNGADYIVVTVNHSKYIEVALVRSDKNQLAAEDLGWFQ